MPKDQTIIIEFDNDLQGTEGNEGAFKISSKEYGILGTLVDVEYPVARTIGMMPRLKKIYKDFTKGDHLNTEASDGIVLMRKEDEI